MPKLTLNRVFAFSLLGLLAGLALLFWMVFDGLQAALLKSAEQSRDKDSAVIGQSVTDYLSQAPAAAEHFEGLLRAGLTRPAEQRSLRDGLLSVLLENDQISEATFTFANGGGFDAKEHLVFDPNSVGQITLFRAREGPGLVYRTTWYENGRFYSNHLHLTPDGAETEVAPPEVASNPALDPTFMGPTLRRLYGTLVWTDVHYFLVDAGMPETRRRVDVSVLKAIEWPVGHFAGVLNIGLFKDAIDRAIETPDAVNTVNQSIFICDNEGRLIAISGSNRYVDSDGDLRVAPGYAAPEVQAALKLPKLDGVDADNPLASGRFAASGTTYLYTFRSLPDTQSWILGVVVPERAYLEDLLKIRDKVFWGSLALTVTIALFGWVMLRAVSVAHSVILHEAALMNDFVLNPSTNSCRFHDINQVLSSLERAKTAMRSMGKYVPMDLVRRLYHRGEEPRLGGEATEISALFTDIQGFTEFAETSDPDIVAKRLGEYLQVMVSVIQGEKGTIDKFIGDSVMAFWNAPEPVADNAALACGAVLGCRRALEELYGSAEWAGMPGFKTRFGLHHCVASVGHFGAPERFNYTAIGDGINLASRLERLNKYYGTSIIVSRAVRDAAKEGFRFRHLDCVAVKGKTQSLDIYELIGESTVALPGYAARYEEALGAWLAGDFQRALALAEAQPEDGPSKFLATRCRALIAAPPAEWAGVYAFDTK